MANALTVTAAIEFCDQMQIPMIICDDDYQIIYYNHSYNILFSFMSASKLNTYFKSQTFDTKTWKSYLNIPQYKLLLRWDLIVSESHKKVFTIRIIDKEPYIKNNLVANLIADSLSVFTKNAQGVYVYCNDYHKKNDHLDILNKTVYDLPWSSQAYSWLGNDKKTQDNLTSSCFYEVTPSTDRNDSQVYLSIKSPISVDDEQMVACVSINLKTIHKEGLREYLNNSSEPDVSIDFTQRELECISFLVQGLSTTEIGKLINKTQKTVEFHIANAKRKLNCYKSSKLSYLVGRFHGYFGNVVN